MKKTIYFYEAFEEEEASLRKFLPTNISAGFTWKTIQEAGHDIPPARIISTRTQSIYPQNWADKLDAIISRSTGYDHLLAYRDYELKQSNQSPKTVPGQSSDFDNHLSEIKMGYLPLYCNRAVAEQALMLILVLLRKLSAQTRQFKKFERDGLTGFELQNKNLVVYGVGNIGYEMVKIGHGLGMNVFGVDITKRHNDVIYLTPEDGAKKADIIVCAMNLTKDNHTYFDQAFFKNVRENAIFINISRGEISPSTVLLKSLKNNLLAGAALDVFDHEKNLSAELRNGQITNDQEVKAILEMMKMENVILTPHNAFNTFESVERKSKQTIEQLKSFLEKGTFIWHV